jgi:hypothetical protein
MHTQRLDSLGDQLLFGYPLLAQGLAVGTLWVSGWSPSSEQPPLPRSSLTSYVVTFCEKNSMCSSHSRNNVEAGD